ncbi:MAG: 16S rRNA (cytosine(1402)-N(4))-methyltransferase RsmH [Chitinivibrionales bacterium]|nr:16S rRNA (cytosine(1402)-N(4))-methyltransferase RsmH [Chitinivibrionales bacterium]MBD3394824.1 16S rRNA (cytosine(1402)-N(4))-methyltransferase RsmH [Chitinivibrionales bacterium]
MGTVTARDLYHVPVLLEECLEGLAVQPGGVYVDGTLGGGGHFEEIIRALGPEGTAIGIDKDPESISRMRKRVSSTPVTVIIERASFSEMDSVLRSHGIGSVDGVLLDLGVSSRQIDDPSRGFSYRHDASLDMRMDPAAGRPAHEMLSSWDEPALARVLSDFGEIRNPERMASAIARYARVRPLHSSSDMLAALELEYGTVRPKVLSKVFQALRIAVNSELDELQTGLVKALDSLKRNGRLVVVSYHSLEDRIVKNFIRDQERGCICPPEVPVCTCFKRAQVKRINRKAIRPSQEEIAGNRRARSARLRMAEKVV